MGKVFERLLDTRFQKSPYGFRWGPSTLNALTDFTATVNRFVRSGRIALVISLNITGAFDCARWSDILDALKKMETPEELIEMCRSFFDRRTVEVKFGEGRATRWLTRGCPQKSIAGPLF